MRRRRNNSESKRTSDRQEHEHEHEHETGIVIAPCNALALSLALITFIATRMLPLNAYRCAFFPLNNLSLQCDKIHDAMQRNPKKHVHFSSRTRLSIRISVMRAFLSE